MSDPTQRKTYLSYTASSSSAFFQEHRPPFLIPHRRSPIELQSEDNSSLQESRQTISKKTVRRVDWRFRIMTCLAQRVQMDIDGVRPGIPLPVCFVTNIAIARCSITSFILSTPMVRTCVGCTRKAFLPPIRKQAKKPEDDGMEVDGTPGDIEPDVTHLPPAARSWIVQGLLRAATRCLFCGNSFVSLL